MLRQLVVKSEKFVGKVLLGTTASRIPVDMVKLQTDSSGRLALEHAKQHPMEAHTYIYIYIYVCSHQQQEDQTPDIDRNGVMARAFVTSTCEAR